MDKNTLETIKAGLWQIRAVCMNAINKYDRGYSGRVEDWLQEIEVVIYELRKAQRKIYSDVSHGE